MDDFKKDENLPGAQVIHAWFTLPGLPSTEYGRNRTHAHSPAVPATELRSPASRETLARGYSPEAISRAVI